MYRKAKANLEKWFLKVKANSDNVLVSYNSRGLDDQDALILRTKDFLLQSKAKNKCMKVEVESPELLHCGPGGNVSFVKSAQPDPNLK